MARQKTVGRGRPRGVSKAVVVSTYVEESLMLKLTKLSKKNKMSISKTISEILSDFFKEKAATKEVSHV